MTHLEYIAEKLMGPPARRGGSDGESYWCCPFHDDSNPSFHTLPHKPGIKDYWKCFGCGLWGDEFNLLRNFRDIVGHPLAMGSYGDHQALVLQWRQEHDRLGLNESTEKKTLAYSFSSVEPLKKRPKPNDDPRTVAFAWANLSEAERDAVWVAFEAVRREQVDFTALGVYDLDFRDFRKRTDEQHLAECNDTECDAVVCRAARGLPAMTPEELEADKRQAEREEAERREKHRAAVERLRQRVNCGTRVGLNGVHKPPPVPRRR